MAKLNVAIPSSLVADTPHLREKTTKLGAIARACAIFGVKEIILYSDSAAHEQGQDLQLCTELLNFIETPQYLRKRLFGLKPSLKFTGILPPLQIPSHDVPRSVRECKPNDVREGLVVNKRGDALMVDVGLERLLVCRAVGEVGTRHTFRLTSVGKDLKGEILEQPTIAGVQKYWGYKVEHASSLGRLIQQGSFDLKIGTSRYGSSIVEVWMPLKNAVQTAKSILIVFGSPRMGLREILEQEKLKPTDVFDYYVNTAPNQRTATVRTEEALLASLGILNLARASSDS